MLDTQQLRDFVLAELNRSPSGVLGTSLATAVRERFGTVVPSELGARNLKELILKNVPEVRVVGRSGADIIYGLAAEDSRQAPPPNDPVHTSLWTIWATPTTQKRLSVKADGSVMIVGQGEDGEHRLEPLSEGHHRQIARDFVDSEEFGEQVRAEMLAVIDDPTAMWWGRWMSVVKANSALNTKWIRFRRDKLLQKLREALAESGLAPELVESSFATISSSSRRARTSHLLGTSELSRLRAIVGDVVARLQESELRALHLPVGLVLDALTRHGRQ